MNENDVKFLRERLEHSKEGVEFGRAIAQATLVRQMARQLAGETKGSRCAFGPAADRFLRGRMIKSRIDFDRRKIARIKFEPAFARQIRRIKRTTPLLETPGASAETDFLLSADVQNESRRKVMTGSGNLTAQ